MTGPSPLAGDEPRFEPAGNFHSVDGMLDALGVADASHADQRAAVARVAVLASVRPILGPLLPERRRRGLV